MVGESRVVIVLKEVNHVCAVLEAEGALSEGFEVV